MRRNQLRYLRTRVIDEITAMRIRQYERLTGEDVRLPVPVEKIVEQILGLNFDWDEIDEAPGEQILGGLLPERATILLNSKHLHLYAKKPGLERSTIGHEAGHWDIDIDRTSLNHPNFPGFDMNSCVVQRRAKNSDVLVQVLNRALSDDRYYKIYQQLTAGQDSPDVSSAVDRYQSSLLMPAWLMRDADERCDMTRWRDLYDLAAEAEVTISNLTVRLQRLDLIYLHEDSKTIHRSRDAFTGQKHLF